MFEQLLIKIANALRKQQIPYMVIGGQAVLLYGEPRLTRDIDVTLGVGVDHLSAIEGLVKKIGFQSLAPDTAFIHETMVFPCQDQETGIRIDLIFSQSAYEQAALQRVNAISFHKTDVFFASAEDVVIHKVIAGRPRDIEDVRAILLKNEDLGLHSNVAQGFCQST
ncbi:nucleotidyl transferase AbiEii/AbiGii toxin family protein [Candidatus Nitrospira salsa]